MSNVQKNVRTAGHAHVALCQTEGLETTVSG